MILIFQDLNDTIDAIDELFEHGDIRFERLQEVFKLRQVAHELRVVDVSFKSNHVALRSPADVLQHLHEHGDVGERLLSGDKMVDIIAKWDKILVALLVRLA